MRPLAQVAFSTLAPARALASRILLLQLRLPPQLPRLRAQV
jgi:hypothetical protein